jgi:hypothetical protein
MTEKDGPQQNGGAKGSKTEKRRERAKRAKAIKQQQR